MLYRSLGLILALTPALQLPPADSCEPCALVRGFIERGDTVSGATTALRYAMAAGDPADAAQLVYMAVAVSPKDRSVLLPDFQDRVPVLEVADLLVDELFADLAGAPSASLLSAYMLLRWNDGAVPRTAMSPAATWIGRLDRSRPLVAPELQGDTLAEVLLLRTFELDVQIKDQSFRATATAPPARYLPCVAGGDVHECWLETRTHDPGSLVQPAYPMVLPEELIAQRNQLLTRAFAQAPDLPLAARRLLAEQSRSGNWEEYHSTASIHSSATDSSGWSLAFLATGLWRSGLAEEADSLFARALESLARKDRVLLRDVSESVRPENEDQYLSGDTTSFEAWSEFLLQVSDPLFLTPVNERRIEHFARTVLTELWFEDPVAGIRGIHTDPGRLQVRYGAPEWVWEISPNDSLPPPPDELVVPGMTDIRPPPGNDVEGVFWTYGPTRPHFLFVRTLGTRQLAHVRVSREYARELRDIEPSTFDFPVVCLAHQVARFRGTDAAMDVDFYAEVPEDTLSTSRVSVQSGLFFLPRTLGQEITSLRTTTTRAYFPTNLTFSAPLGANSYVYAIEVLSEDWAVRKASRGSVEVSEPSTDRTSLSDIVLSHSMEAKVEVPRSRRDLQYDPSVDLSFGESEPLHVFFEIYPANSLIREGVEYTVTVRIRNLRRRSFFSRALRSVRGVLGSTEGNGRLRWRRTADASDGRIVEWFRLEAPWTEPGPYELQVIVAVPGEELTVTRRFTVLGDDEDVVASCGSVAG